MYHNHRLPACLVIVSLGFAALAAQADHEKSKGRKQLSANEIIGKKVMNNQNEDVDNGVAHLYGTVESEAKRQNIEAKVRGVSGVQRVESPLKVKNQ